MSARSVGRIDWILKRDRDGHRDYSLKMLVETDSSSDGPAVVYAASGLPAIGSQWIFGNDNDPWAFCSPEASVSPVITPDPNFLWIVDIPFTTRPFKRCQDSQISNPLNEPQKISGSFVKYVTALRRRADTQKLILSSSHEPITGLEKDANRPTVTIEQNISVLGLNTFSAMVDTTNDRTLWGLTTGKIKLDNVSWERKIYGTCSFYYTRRFEFAIRYEGYNLVDVADAGFKKFDSTRYTDTPTNRADPTKYILAKDGRGENPPEKVLLNGSGSVLTNPLAPIFLSTIAVYGTSNFLTLDIPTVL